MIQEMLIPLLSELLIIEMNYLVGISNFSPIEMTNKEIDFDILCRQEII